MSAISERTRKHGPWVLLATLAFMLASMGFGEVNPNRPDTEELSPLDQTPTTGLRVTDRFTWPEVSGTELTEYRTAQSRTYALDDQNYKTIVRSDQGHGRDRQGAWRAVQSSRWQSAGDEVRGTTEGLDVRWSRAGTLDLQMKGDRSGSFRMDTRISIMSNDDARNIPLTFSGTPRVLDNRMMLKSVEGPSLALELSRGKLKQAIVLTEPLRGIEPNSQLVIREQIELGENLFLEEVSGNTALHIVDASGEVVAWLPTPIAKDAQAARYEDFHQGVYRLVEEDGIRYIDTVFDTNFLINPDTVYPVELDPSVVLGSAAIGTISDDENLWQGQQLVAQYNSQHLSVGFTSFSTKWVPWGITPTEITLTQTFEGVDGTGNLEIVPLSASPLFDPPGDTWMELLSAPGDIVFTPKENQEQTLLLGEEALNNFAESVLIGRFNLGVRAAGSRDIFTYTEAPALLEVTYTLAEPLAVTSGCPGGGQSCEGDDDDACNEGGVKQCTFDKSDSYCGEGPVGMWGDRAPHNNTVHDVSGYGNDGTAYNVTWSNSLKAFYFNGVNSYIKVPASESLETPHGYTLEAWIRPQNDNDYWTGIIGQVGMGVRSYHMWMGRSNSNSYNKKSFIHHTHGNACSSNNAHNSPNFTNNGSTWQHIIVTADPNGKRRIYRNGSLVANSNACGEILGTSDVQPVHIGRNLDGGNGNYYKGHMKNLAIYNYAITASQVSDHYNNGIPEIERNFEFCDGKDNDCDGHEDEPYNIELGCDDGDADSCNDQTVSCDSNGITTTCIDKSPAVYFDFEVKSGSTIYDHSGNGNTGSAKGGAKLDSTSKIGSKSLILDGSSDYVDHSTSGMTNDRGTIALWLRPQGWSGSSYNAYGVFQTNSGVNSTNWISLFKWYGSIFYFRLGSSSSCCSNDLTFNPSSYLKNNKWVHMAATWDQDTNSMKVYFDGQLAASRSNIKWSAPAIHSKARLGQGHDRWWKGRMDDYVTYPYALSQSEIQELMAKSVHDDYINLEGCDGYDNDCDGLVDNTALSTSACDDGVACTYDRCLLGRCVHMDPADPQPDNPVLCEISGSEGDTATCVIKLARKNEDDKLPVAMQMSLEYPEAQVSLSHFTGTVDGFLQVPPFLLPYGHSAILSPTNISSWNGGGEMFILNSSEVKALTPAYYILDAQQGSSTMIVAHFDLNEDIPADEPVRILGADLLPADEDAAQLSYYIASDGTIVTTRSTGLDCVSGVPCDDKNPCTTNDTCANGQCKGTTIFCQDDANPCTHNFCDPALGCVSVPATNSCGCEDGEFCTTSDTCHNAGCVGGPPPSCDDDNICTDDVCISGGVGCQSTANTVSHGTCDTGMPGECTDGINQCEGGASYCRPDVPEYGVLGNVSVPGGLMTRHTGNVGGGWQLITSNGKYLFNLSYGQDGTPYKGWTYRIFDPADNFSMIKNKKVNGSTFYTDGVVADDTYIYPIQWNGQPVANVYRINWQTDTLETGWTIGQKYKSGHDPISGQYDWSHEKVFMGSLTAGKGMRWAANPWAPNGSQSNPAYETSFNLASVAGAGVTATDGTYLYVKRWASYAGDDYLKRVGTGYNGTTAGAYYGKLTQSKTVNSLTAAYHSDGYVYNPRKHSKLLQRARATHAVPEICDGLDNDCDGHVDEDFINLGDPCDTNDIDSCNDGIYLCKANGTGTECIDQGPLTHYGLNEGAGAVTTDLSGNSHSGAISGGTLQTTAKLGAGSVYMDGSSDYITTPTAGMSNKSGTIALWLKPDGWSGSSYQAYGIFQTNSGVNSTNWLSVFKWFGNIVYFRLGSSASCCTNDLTFASAPYFPNGTWSHLTATWDQKTDSMRVYINGSLVASRSNVNWNAPAFHTLGRFGQGHDQWFRGNMDDIVVYDRAISASEITNLMNNSVPAIQDNLEICDSLDNDCDTSTDEGYPVGQGCGIGQCAGGGRECTATNLDTQCDTMPGGSQDQSSVEICDYADNDCDAATDEGFNVGSYCDTGMFGECTDGVIQCGSPTSSYTFDNAASTQFWFQKGSSKATYNASGGKLAQTGNTSLSYYLVPDNSAVGDFTYEAEITSYDDDNFYLIWNYATNSNRDYIRFHGGNKAAPGNESIRWTGSGGVFYGLNWSNGDKLFVRLEITGNTGKVWAQNMTTNSPLVLALSGTIDPAIHGTIGVATSWNHSTDFDNLSIVAAQGPYCEPDHEPVPELCDNLDNDCDNKKDENFKTGGDVSLTDLDGTTGLRLGDDCGVGACAGGEVVCSDDQTQLKCSTHHLAHAEVCDGIDNDCDGKLDAADPTDLLANDLQGCENQTGVCDGSKKPVYLCQNGGWNSCGNQEYTIHDSNFDGSSEVRCDGKDNDCDGGIDEDFSVTLLTGDTVTGIGKACGAGVCAGGTTQCTSNGLGIHCPTEANASPEVCDALDNDCDAKTDHSGGDGADLLVHDLQSCENQNGVCASSTKPSALCVGGNWQACTHTQYSNHSALYEIGSEVHCDGHDNDCDASTDEDFSVTLLTGSTVTGIGKACGAGVCAGGTTTCTANDLGIYCPTEANAAPEICDALDNDCDAKTDHSGGDGADLLTNDLRDCENQKGVCVSSTKPSYLCVGGNWNACTDTEYGNHSALYESGTETKCDGHDNECDGDTDDDFSVTLMDGSTVISGGIGETCGFGSCAGGTTECNASADGVVCSTESSGSNNQVSAEVCDAVDNDCDNKTDHSGGDGPDLLVNDLRDCENQKGVCVSSTKPSYLCVGGNWNACTDTEYGNHSALYESGTETKCDGHDNECDGDTDDDFSVTLMDGSTVISGGIGETCGFGSCAGGTTECNASADGVVCSTESSGSNNQVSAEVCDAVDNDCDNKTDHSGGDGPDLLVNDLRDCENQKGVCVSSTKPSYLCVGGNWNACTDTEYGNHSALYESGTETKCDGHDNECDGDTDDDFSVTLMDGSTVISGGIGETCGFGACSGGTTECNASADGVVCSTESSGSNNQVSAEVCDAIDNDCDNKTDHSGGDGADLLVNDLRDCENQNGVCSSSTKPSYLCVSGNWNACTDTEYSDHSALYESGTETKCDGYDNECDADIDDDFSVTLMDGSTVITGGIGETCGFGACSGGTTECNASANGVVCSTESSGSNNQVSAEVCDAIDNDCDNKTDHSGGDGADLLANDLRECENQNGVCYYSTKPSYLCVGGNWNACTDTEYSNHSALYESGTETKCDGYDNECDADIDDDFSVTLMDGSTVISGGIGETCGFGACSGGVTQCNASADGVVCSTESSGSNNQVSNEVCDAIDNDCDNLTDHVGGDGADLLVNDLRDCENQNGVCVSSTKPSYLCVNGSWDTCTDTEYGNHSTIYEPEPELTCDDEDNDCDTNIDEEGICDMDGDGFAPSDGDCNDDDPEVYPGAPEFCNGIDDDCDTLTDAADPTDLLAADLQICENQNGVCVGSTKPASLCVSGVWTACGNTQYANHASTYEAGAEVSCDALDNDCDADVDDDFTMTLGDGSTTVSGGIGETCGLGECVGGTTECNAAGTGIRCSTEAGGSATKQVAETCDYKDNDCDGVKDEDHPYVQESNGALRYTEDLCDGVGECGLGFVECLSPTVAICNSDPQGTKDQSVAETCDYKDNDCNGVNDNGIFYEGGGVGEGCDGIGECGVGFVECHLPTELPTCSTNPNGSVDESVAETCDYKDNDCDNLSDEDFQYDGHDIYEDCDGVGECGAGTVECFDLNTATCSTNPGASSDESVAEVCNNLDDDCDASIDETLQGTPLPQFCYDGPAGTLNVGICHGGTQYCSAGVWGACQQQTLPQPDDKLCDGIDTDCNGTADEDYIFIPCGIGACASLSDCVNGIEIACEPGDPGPHDQTCDNIDDDCNGQEDEDYIPIICGLGVCERASSCDPGGIENPCVVGEPTGDDTDCDTLDDDCDGSTDEHFTDNIDCTVDICVDGDDQNIPTDSLCDDVQPCTDNVCLAANNVAGGCIYPSDDTNIPDPAFTDTNDCTDLRCVDGTSQNVNDDTNIPDDGTACTDDYCEAGVDYHPPSAGTCLINGAECFMALEKNPADGCQICFPQESQTDWSPTLFRETFESGDMGLMTNTTLEGPISWHVTNDLASVSDYSAWFGEDNTGTYATGSRVHGQLVMPSVYLAPDASHWLRFHLYLDTEMFTSAPLYDLLKVQAVLNPNTNPQEVELWDSTTHLGGTTWGVWETVYLDVTAYGGYDVQFMFDFDSGDEQFNNYSGAYIDDVSVRTGCCVEDADCNDGNTCTVGLCNSGVCDYEDICEPPCVRTTPNVAFLLDRSVSMSYPRIQGGPMTKWQEVGQALELVANEHQATSNLGLKTYPSDVGFTIGCTMKAGMDAELRSTSIAIQQAMAATTPTGYGNSVAAGLYSLMGDLQNTTYSGPKFVIVITDDGEGCDSDSYVLDAIDVLRSAGITTLIVGYGPDVYHDQLNQLALAGGMPNPIELQSDEPYYNAANDLPELIQTLDDLLSRLGSEICDGLDNDCDGQFDEDILPVACNPECSGGGEQACVGGLWSECSVVPEPESCNGWDDDCDGLVDEEWIPDVNGNSIDGICSKGIGACKEYGNYVCNPADIYGPLMCTAVAGQPTPEVCDAIDNDCDAVVDEALTKSCFDGPAESENVGICKSGITSCTLGQWGDCEGQVLPGLEICNGEDDDCDTKTDYADAADLALNDVHPCSNQQGVCAGSITPPHLCYDGQWHPCEDGDFANYTSLYEAGYELSCDGKDNDCDGAIDDDFTMILMDGETVIGGGIGQQCGLGMCSGGYTECNATQDGIRCSSETGGSKPKVKNEFCNDIDDDCDGITDESDNGVPLSKECYSGGYGEGIGACTSGVTSCVSGVFGDCEGEVVPEDELCDGIDNDCDGYVDEFPGQICLDIPECYLGNCKCGPNAVGEYRCYLD